MLPNVFALAAAVLTGAASSAFVVVVMDRPAPVESTRVVRVVDGETVEVRDGDRVSAVKLVNVDAPAAAECLHQESVARLDELLPAGSAVTVVRDGEFAALSTQDGVLVNAELIRAGLAVPVVNGTRFLGAVREANQSAATGLKGLHSPEVPCTLPGQVRVITEAAAVVERQSVRAGRAELAVAADTAKNAIGLIDQLAKPGGVTWDAVAPVDQTALLARVTKAVPTLYRKEAELRSALKGLR